MEPSNSLAYQAFRLIGAAAAAVSRAVRPDHASIHGRQMRIFGTAMVRHYLYAAVAPSRRAARPHDSATVNRAQVFAELVVGSELASRPAFATTDFVVFGTEDPNDHAWTRRLIVHRTGLVELLWALDLVADETTTDRLLLPVLDVLDPVRALAASVSRAEYASLTSLRRPWRRRARVDWWFAVTTHVSGASGTVAWNALGFPEAVPPRAGQDVGLMPPDGYGGPALRSTSRRRPGHVVKNLLEQLLAANGYYNTDDIVTDILTHDRTLPVVAGPKATTLSKP